MQPILIDFGTVEIAGKVIPITIGGYGLMFVLGIVSGWLWFRHLGRRIDPDANWTDLYFLTIIAGLLGAKLANLIVFLPDLVTGKRSILGVLTGGGVWLGGVILGVAVFLLLARRFRATNGQLVNTLFVAVPFGHAVGRFGCLLGGCCYGSPTNLPWAVTYADPIARRMNGTPLGTPVHPTAVYEAGLEFVNFGVCYWLWRRGAPDWSILAVWAGLYGAQRFFLEYLRGDPRGYSGPLSPSQWVSVSMVALSLAFLFAIRRRWQPRTRG